MQKIDFNEQERHVVEEAFQQFMQVTTVIARLRGLNGAKLAQVQLAPDRSGFILPEGDK